MTQYQITSKAGVDMGIFEGSSKAEALCFLHWDAGCRNCTVENDYTIFFECEEDERLFGQVKDWHFDEIKDLFYAYGRRDETEPFTLDFFGDENTDGFDTYEEAEFMAEAQIQIWKEEFENGDNDCEFKGEYEIRQESKH